MAVSRDSKDNAKGQSQFIENITKTINQKEAAKMAASMRGASDTPEGSAVVKLSGTVSDHRAQLNYASVRGELQEGFINDRITLFAELVETALRLDAQDSPLRYILKLTHDLHKMHETIREGDRDLDVNEFLNLEKSLERAAVNSKLIVEDPTRNTAPINLRNDDGTLLEKEKAAAEARSQEFLANASMDKVMAFSQEVIRNLELNKDSPKFKKGISEFFDKHPELRFDKWQAEVFQKTDMKIDTKQEQALSKNLGLNLNAEIHAIKDALKTNTQTQFNSGKFNNDLSKNYKALTTLLNASANFIASHKFKDDPTTTGKAKIDGLKEIASIIQLIKIQSANSAKPIDPTAAYNHLKNTLSSIHSKVSNSYGDGLMGKMKRSGSDFLSALKTEIDKSPIIVGETTLSTPEQKGAGLSIGTQAQEKTNQEEAEVSKSRSTTPTSTEYDSPPSSPYYASSDSDSDLSDDDAPPPPPPPAEEDDAPAVGRSRSSAFTAVSQADRLKSLEEAKLLADAKLKAPAPTPTIETENEVKQVTAPQPR